MENQDLLHRAHDIVSRTERLAELLGEVECAVQQRMEALTEIRKVTAADYGHLLLRSRESLLASARLLAETEDLLTTSHASPGAVVSVPELLPGSAHHGEGWMKRSREMIARSHALLAQPVLRAETLPNWHGPLPAPAPAPAPAPDRTTPARP